MSSAPVPTSQLNRRRFVILFGAALASLRTARANDISESTDGESSAASSEDSSLESSKGSVVAMLVILAILVVGAIIAIVIVVTTVNKKKKNEAKRRKRAAAMIDVGLMGERQDLGHILTRLRADPAAMDRLFVQVMYEEGPELEALAAAMCVPVPVMVGALRAAGPPPASLEAVDQLLVDVAIQVAPEMIPDDAAAGAFLWRLRTEGERGEPGPAHAHLRRWLGLPDQPIEALVAGVLAPLHDRGATFSSAGDHLDRLAGVLEEAYPLAIDAKVAELAERAAVATDGRLVLPVTAAG